MKVLINRFSSYLFARLTILAHQFGWSARTDEAILIKMLTYLNYHQVVKHIYSPNPFRPSEANIKAFISTLPPEKLRRLLRLADVICRFPDMFDRLFECFCCVPLFRLNRILYLDRKFLQSPLFTHYECSSN